MDDQAGGDGLDEPMILSPDKAAESEGQRLYEKERSYHMEGEEGVSGSDEAQDEEGWEDVEEDDEDENGENDEDYESSVDDGYNEEGEHYEEDTYYEHNEEDEDNETEEGGEKSSSMDKPKPGMAPHNGERREALKRQHEQKAEAKLRMITRIEEEKRSGKGSGPMNQLMSHLMSPPRDRSRSLAKQQPRSPRRAEVSRRRA